LVTAAASRLPAPRAKRPTSRGLLRDRGSRPAAAGRPAVPGTRHRPRRPSPYPAWPNRTDIPSQTSRTCPHGLEQPAGRSTGRDQHAEPNQSPSPNHRAVSMTADHPTLLSRFHHGRPPPVASHEATALVAVSPAGLASLACLSASPNACSPLTAAIWPMSGRSALAPTDLHRVRPLIFKASIIYAAAVLPRRSRLAAAGRPPA